jgi:hypothetical protein
MSQEETRSMSTDETKQPTKATSPRKIEANRRNAQHSTGPKTDEGKAKSSQNSITHGIFVTKFLSRATPETVSEIEELAAGLREYYEPEGILGEILVQKIIVENARYGRVLTLEQLEQLEQPEPVYNLARVVHCLDRTSRYSTATSRALYKAIEELERHEAAESSQRVCRFNGCGTVQATCRTQRGQAEKLGENPASSDSRAFEGPEDGDGKVEAA